MTAGGDDRNRVEPLRVGILGGAGQLATCLHRAVSDANSMTLAFSTTRTELDLANPRSVSHWIDALDSDTVDVVINAAAHTKVDACEDEVELAYQVNAEAPGQIAAALHEHGIRFVQPSTDYVFAGDANRPYVESDETGPQTVYGASKLAGEVAVANACPEALIVRTSWVFGPGRNFVAAILDQAAKRRNGEVDRPLQVVDDQLGSPTFAADLADAILEILNRAQALGRGAEGILHLRSREETTWFGFAQAILEECGYSDVAIEPVPTGAFKTKASRPAYSVLDCSKAQAMGIELPSWRDGLVRYLRSPDRPRIETEEPVSARTGKAFEAPS